MKRKILAILTLSLSAIIVMLAAGCSSETLSTEKLRDIDFTVVDEDDIPEPLEEMIDEREDKPFKLTYADNGALYCSWIRRAANHRLQYSGKGTLRK